MMMIWASRLTTEAMSMSVFVYMFVGTPAKSKERPGWVVGGEWAEDPGCRFSQHQRRRLGV